MSDTMRDKVREALAKVEPSMGIGSIKLYSLTDIDEALAALSSPEQETEELDLLSRARDLLSEFRDDPNVDALCKDIDGYALGICPHECDECDSEHCPPLQPAAPAPEKGEAKRCAWCGGVFASTADGYLTCGKCGKQINPEAYCDPSEIEINTPADDLYKDAPAQPAPSEEIHLPPMLTAKALVMRFQLAMASEEGLTDSEMLHLIEEHDAALRSRLAKEDQV